MARQQKTERQRAEEALAVAHRKRDRLFSQFQDIHKEAARIEREMEEAERILAYRRQHPALQSTTPTTTQENA